MSYRYKCCIIHWCRGHSNFELPSTIDSNEFECRGGLVAEFRIRDPRVMHSRLISSEPPCIWAWYMLNLSRVKALKPSGWYVVEVWIGVLAQVTPSSSNYGLNLQSPSRNSFV
ncbi:hypothetical protein AVEN_146174-1 [Araneus ventricosus]|uniref:Uncharacterized protein n=1 Tax=Araneus ventricosus TaxID=182803 RepID=A0A4Y2CIQ5_ARAVE|nr:hypothetical protein AVEN_146174-1 [Araneus ventricosus]